MRSQYCGEVNERLVGKTIILCGWVHRARNLGGMIFFRFTRSCRDCASGCAS